MSEPKLDKGDRVAIVGGRKGAGMRGEIFWVGENKYGPGQRFGVRGDDGETYWVDASHTVAERDAPDPPPKIEKREGATFDKGDRVTIVGGGQGEGVTGEVFWIGESKFGPGMRYGVRAGEDATYWVDGAHLQAAEPADADAAPSAGERRDDDLPPEAFEGDDEDLPF